QSTADLRDNAKPRVPADPTISHQSAPVVVSTWGTEEPAGNVEPVPVSAPLPAAPRRGVPPALVACAVIAAVGLVAAATFAIIDRSQPTQPAPTAAPPT